jgi:hypothetical protein
MNLDIGGVEVVPSAFASAVFGPVVQVIVAASAPALL